MLLFQRPSLFLLNPWIAGLFVFSATSHDAWPNGPFLADGRWITDASGLTVTYAGVNWPGHVETMIPEGLQYQSIASIMAKVKSLGMNAIRLTYATEMIDVIEENGGRDVPIGAAFIDVLGQKNGTAILEKVLSNNPSFTSNTTRLQVFDALAAEAAKNEIYIHLDNHVSKAGWCCTPLDGNTWWGDTYFSVANWTRGLSYMAEHGKQWPNLMSMSLRNELRQPLLNSQLLRDSYNWQDWYKYVQQGAQAINSANPDVLIFLSGLDSDTTLQPVVQNAELSPGSLTFDPGAFPDNKIVLELHNYANILDTPQADNCTGLQQQLFEGGFQTLQDGSTNMFPVVMTEFGFQQDATTWQGTFATCLENYLGEQRVGWTIWTLSGSFYIREGAQDRDEPWGLLTHDWSGWRSPEHVDGILSRLVNMTLAANGLQPNSSSGSNDSSPSSGTSQDSRATELCAPSNTWAVRVWGIICVVALVMI